MCGRLRARHRGVGVGALHVKRVAVKGDPKAGFGGVEDNEAVLGERLVGK